MNISVTDQLPLFTNEIVAKYSDHRRPKSFGRSLFTEVETATKLASFLSQRGLNLVATDVARGSRGSLNVFDKSTQSTVLPPYFNEFFNITELDSYDALAVEGVNAKIAWGRFLDDVATKMMFCMDKIDRRYELQCWQLLLTGIVTINNGQNVQYGRKAGSLVNPGAGNYWADSGIDPFTSFERGATWLNETGKMPGNTIMVIFGQSAWKNYTENTAVKARNLWFNNNMDVIADKAIVNSTGGTFKGVTTVGAYNYEFWVYPDFYETEAGVKTQYVDTKKIVMIPAEMRSQTLTYTAVPQRIIPGQTPAKGKFLVWNAVSEFNDAEFMGAKSAGIPTLVAVDQVYTEQVVA